MDDIIKDDVLGELKYIKSNMWGRRLDVPFLNSDGNLILTVQDDNKDGILDVQREAYNRYMQNEDKYKSCVTDLLLDYYKWNYENVARIVSDLDENDHKDVVTEKEVLYMAPIWYLFICRDGSFGYAFGCCWDKENGIAVLLSESEPRVISRTQLKNLHKLNDPTVGLLVHDGKNAWKGLEVNKFFGKPENLEIELEGGVDEGITEAQQKAYSDYLERKQSYFDELTKMMLGVYVGSDEQAEAMLKTGQKIFMMDVLPKTLFIDREGNFGWICHTKWDDSYLGVLLSEDKLYFLPDIKLRNYRNEDTTKDDLLGLLFPVYYGYEKTIIVKLVDEILTLDVLIKTKTDKLIDDEIRNAYSTYLKMRPTFWTGIKKEMLRCYLSYYKLFEDNLEIPEELKKENVTEDNIMSIVTFTDLSINYFGDVAWEFDNPLGDYLELAFSIKNEEIEIIAQVDII